MKRTITALGTLLALAGGPGEAIAHHSFAVHFVPDEIVTVSGVVTEFRFRNPHGLVFFAVDGENGKEIWRAETNSPNVLRRRGWNDSSLAIGDRITVEGYPSRDDSHTMRIARVIFEDGRELIGQRPDAGAANDND